MTWDPTENNVFAIFARIECLECEVLQKIAI